MKSIIVATGNKDKVSEIQEILKIPLEYFQIEVDEVQSMDLEYVAMKKAEKAYEVIRKPLIVDDVGVYIKAWNDLPGPFVKYTYKHMGLKKVLEIMAREKDRSLVVKCALAFHDGNKIHTFLGAVKGTLSKKILGKDGWGFDPVIIPDGFKLTFAQMGIENKNKVSHRALAFKKLKKFLDSKNKLKVI